MARVPPVAGFPGIPGAVVAIRERGVSRCG
jgi:hypothetical protein